MSPRTDEGRRRRWPVRRGAQRSGARPSGGEEGGIWPGPRAGSWLLQWRLGDRVLPAATTGEQARSQDPPCTSRGSRQEHVQEAVVLGGCPVPRHSFPLLDDALEDPLSTSHVGDGLNVGQPKAVSSACARNSRPMKGRVLPELVGEIGRRWDLLCSSD